MALHAAWSLLVEQQTMLANSMLGLATEFGLAAPKGIRQLGQLMVQVKAGEIIPKEARQAMGGLYVYCNELSKGSRPSKRKSSPMPVAMRPPAVWRRSPASV